MNPTDQISTAIGTWTDAQKKLWEGWMGVLNQAAELNTKSTESANWLKQSADMFGKGTSEAARDMVDKLLNSQDAVSRGTEFFLKAWKVVAPSFDAGKDWRGDLQGFATQWSQQMSQTLERGAGAQSDFTQLAMSMFKDWPMIMLPWMAFMQKSSAAGHLGEATLGGSANLTKLLAMESEVYPFFSGLAELPRAGLTREKNARLLKLADAASDYRRTSLKFHAAMAQGMAKAVESTIERLGEMRAKGEKISSVRDLMKLWFSTADGSLMHTFNSPEFLALQNDMTGAMNMFRVRQREVLEDVYQALDIPTRSEIDDTYKIIHDLKMEVRALKKQIGSSEGKAAAKSARSGARGTSGKSKGA
jgi:class III poly(R)-hydroxyalkanoic acid synthase PhaE subunit